MKCLTIHNPYPALILTPQKALPKGYFQKRVENRNNHWNYRGPLLIHAGLSTAAVSPQQERDIGPFAYGAIVGVVELVCCAKMMAKTPSGKPTFAREVISRWPWIVEHAHTFGPFCLVLENARRFAEPIPYKGQQGLYGVDDSVVTEAIRTAYAIGE